MLLLSEQTTLNHAGLNPQSIATVGSLLGARPTIVAKPGGDGGQGAGSGTGGSALLGTGLVYANITVPAGNTIANTAAATAFTSAFTIPSLFLQAGTVIMVKAWGVYSTALVAPTITMQLLYGATSLLSTGAVTAIASIANRGWSGEAQLHVAVAGGSGQIEAQGYGEFATAATTSLSVNMANIAPVAMNTALSNALSLQVTWGTASASNTITLRNLSVRIEQALNFS